MPSKCVLVVWGGWEGHTPKAAVDRFIPALRAHDFAVEVRDTLEAYADPSLMARVDLIVQAWTEGTITPLQERGLLDAVEAGTGFAGWHGGIIDSFRENTAYQWMTGGQFVAHPGKCIPSFWVRLVDAKHAITQGLADFPLFDTEQYWVHVDPAIHVLARTRFSGEHGATHLYPAGVEMPCVWTKTWGRGRVFVATWGHTAKDFDVPEAFEIVERGLLWASRAAI